MNEKAKMALILKTLVLASEQKLLNDVIWMPNDYGSKVVGETLFEFLIGEVFANDDEFAADAIINGPIDFAINELNKIIESKES